MHRSAFHSDSSGAPAVGVRPRSGSQQDLHPNRQPLNRPNGWDHALIAAAMRMNAMDFPMLLLVGPQGLIYPNPVMKPLLALTGTGDVTGKPLVQAMPQGLIVYESLLAGLKLPASKPIMINTGEGAHSVWYQLSLKPIVTGTGRIVGAQGYASDVTPHLARIQTLCESGQSLATALESSGIVGIWNLDPARKIITADAKVARTFGLKPADCQRGLRNNTFLKAIHPDDRSKVSRALQDSLIRQEAFHCKFRVTSQEGNQRWVVISAMPCFNPTGQLIRMTGTVVDMTDQTETVHRLKQTRFEFETLTEALPQMVWSCDAQGHHDYFSGRWCEFTGLSQDEIDESILKKLVDPDHREMASRVWEEARANGTPYDIDYRFRHHSGAYRWIRVMALPIRDEQGQITRWFGTSTDVHETYIIAAERERFACELERIASEDQLTKALTRRAFVERANSAISNAIRKKTPIGLIMMDIDHFKSINDRHGHPSGDKVLMVTSRRIRQSVSKSDYFGRLGGEEFGLLMENCSPQDVLAVAERIRNAIQRDPITLDGGIRIPVTLSLGATACIPDTCNLDNLLTVADKALYTAKERGRNLAVYLDHNASSP